MDPISIDLAAGVEDMRFSLSRFDAAPSPAELLEHLRLRSQRYMWEREMDGGLLRMAGLNTHLPEMNPWELPGMAHDEHGKAVSGKCYVTDCFQLQTDIYSPTTPQGFWKPRDLGRGVPGKSDDPRRFVGLKRTYRFYMGRSHQASTETIWTMNVYYLVNDKDFVRDDLVLCHVFEDKSADDDPQPECAGMCHGTPADKGVTVPVLYGLVPLNMPSCDQHAGDPHRSIDPRSSGSTQHGSSQHMDPEFSSYIEELEQTLLGDPEICKVDNDDPNGGGPSNESVCTENGQTRKRSRNKSNKSPVWERFTKIFAQSPDGILTLAICNHCFKVLKGDSSHGTSHLKRHKCPCNHKQPNT